MNKKIKLTIQLLGAIFLIAVGAGLLIAGFCVPPLGVIHSSVLVAFGETCTFAGALFGVDYTYKYKMYVKENKVDKKETENQQV